VKGETLEYDPERRREREREIFMKRRITLGEQAKALGMTTEELFTRLYIDSGRYHCMQCGNEEKDSYSRCPKCGATFSYTEIPWKPPTQDPF